MNDLGYILNESDHEHDGNLLDFLEVCRKNNLTLNPDTMHFRLPKVPSLVIPGVTKVFQQIQEDEAMKRMEIPKDVETIGSFLGLINYLNQFSAGLLN